jgi:ATP synthase protein I
MQPLPTHSGEMSQDSSADPAHRTHVSKAASTGKRAYESLTSSAVGLELGLSVIIGALFGRWLDGEIGTDPWMMILFLILGFVAGIRGVLREVNKIDRRAAKEAANG